MTAARVECRTQAEFEACINAGNVAIVIGLHFSPHPKMALDFNPTAKRFVACQVKLSDIAVHPDGSYPQKIKAKGCCGPVVEVDRNGKPV